MNVRHVVSMMVMMAACAVQAHEVVGLWTFSGEEGAKVDDFTEFPNAVSGSELKLRSVRWSSGWQYSGRKPVYTNNVPAGHLFSDGALTNRIATLSTALCLEGGSAATAFRSSGWLNGSALEMPNFGACFDGNQSWTVEILACASKTSLDLAYTNENKVSLLGVGTHSSTNMFPAIICNPFTNGGQLKAYSNKTTVVEANFYNWKPNRISGTSVVGDRWRLIQLSYDAKNKKYIYRSDYDDFYFDATATGYDVGSNSVFRIGGMWGPTFDGKVPTSYDDYYNYLTLGRLDVAAVRVSKGVVPMWSAMMPWVEKTPKQLVHYRFAGNDGALAKRVDNAVAPRLDFTKCANIKSPSGSDVEESVVYTNFVTKPYIRTQTEPQVRVENLGSASSLTNGAWGVLKYYLQNLPAYYADSFTIETIWWCQNGILSQDVPAISVPLFRAPDFLNGMFLEFRQYTFRLTAYNVTAGEEFLVTPWGAYAPQRQVWNHVALVYDKPQRKMSVYLNGTKLTSFASGKNGTIPEGAKLVNYRNVTYEYAQILGDTQGWAQAFRGVIDEFRITRGVLEPKDFLTPKQTSGIGTTILLR